MERRENEYERKGEMKGKEAKGGIRVREESEEGGVGRKGREGKCWNA